LQEPLFKGHISPPKYAIYELHFCIKLPFFLKYFHDSTARKTVAPTLMLKLLFTRKYKSFLFYYYYKQGFFWTPSQEKWRKRMLLNAAFWMPSSFNVDV